LGFTAVHQSLQHGLGLDSVLCKEDLKK
jgi:hypothetical protein